MINLKKLLFKESSNTMRDAPDPINMPGAFEGSFDSEYGEGSTDEPLRIKTKDYMKQLRQWKKKVFNLLNNSGKH